MGGGIVVPEAGGELMEARWATIRSFAFRMFPFYRESNPRINPLRAVDRR
jgi:hypothetical protein